MARCALFVLSIVVTLTKSSFAQAPSPPQIFVRLNQLDIGLDIQIGCSFFAQSIAGNVRYLQCENQPSRVRKARRNLLPVVGVSSITTLKSISPLLRQVGRFFIRVGASSLTTLKSAILTTPMFGPVVGVHAAAALWLQSLARCRLPLIRWSHRVWTAAGRHLRGRARRLARRGRSAEVPF